MVIKFSVREQTISLLPTKSIPRIGSKDYLVLQFVFSNDWDSLSKVVYLQKDSFSEPIELVGDTLKVPEWFTEQDTFNVTLLGVGDTQEVPTNVVSIKLEKSNTLWNEDAPVPQPSWLVTVLEAAKRVEEAVVNPPKIGSNGNWFVWDFEANQYVDTGVAASGGGSGAVSSVNGKTGAVTLTAGDVGAVPAPATAQVGQTIRVKAVDESGKPTEWEASDIQSGESEWVQIAAGDVGEDVVAFEFTGLESYKELLFCGEWDKGTDTGAIIYLNGVPCTPHGGGGYFVHHNQAKQVGMRMKYLAGRRVEIIAGSTMLNSSSNQDWRFAVIVTLPTTVTGDRADTLKIQLSKSGVVIPSGGKYALYGRA